MRIAETDVGMLNSIGLANPGRDVFLAETLPRLRELGVPVWISVGGFAAHEYAETCAQLDDVTIELNLSCPNVEEAADTAAAIVAACRGSHEPAALRQAFPANWDISEVARAVQAAGADGLSLVNTMRGTALDEATLEPRLGTWSGGLSGPALKPVALAAVYACWRATQTADRRHGRRHDGTRRARARRRRAHGRGTRDGPLPRSRSTASACARSSPRRSPHSASPTLTTCVALHTKVELHRFCR